MGDIQIAMTVDGITCAHCVKIVETVLRGCNGNKSPIDGLLDAASDRALCMVLIKIDKITNAKRIAFEAARNLAMVGYAAKAKEMSLAGANGDKSGNTDLGALNAAFEIVANSDSKDFFNWNNPCTCPDNGILRDDCARHSQMNRRIFEAFDDRERKVTEYISGSAQNYGMAVNGGSEQTQLQLQQQPREQQMQQQNQNYQSVLQQDRNSMLSNVINQQSMGAPQQSMGAPQQSMGVSQQSMGAPHQSMGAPQQSMGAPQQSMGAPQALNQQVSSGMIQHPQSLDFVHDGYGQNPVASPDNGISRRNNSIVSFGNNFRTMSTTSETTFGRAMSGLSALSIDWETLEDFDVNVDHSSHINNQNMEQFANMPNTLQMAGARRSSLRKSFINGPQNDSQEGAHVSFKV